MQRGKHFGDFEGGSRYDGTKLQPSLLFGINSADQCIGMNSTGWGAWKNMTGIKCVRAVPMTETVA
jgi:hypothetical protein